MVTVPVWRAAPSGRRNIDGESRKSTRCRYHRPTSEARSVYLATDIANEFVMGTRDGRCQNRCSNRCMVADTKSAMDAIRYTGGFPRPENRLRPAKSPQRVVAVIAHRFSCFEMRRVAARPLSDRSHDIVPLAGAAGPASRQEAALC